MFFIIVAFSVLINVLKLLCLTPGLIICIDFTVYQLLLAFIFLYLFAEDLADFAVVKLVLFSSSRYIVNYFLA